MRDLPHSRRPAASVERDVVIDYASPAVERQKPFERFEQYEGRAG
jgi:hypothetical protein